MIKKLLFLAVVAAVLMYFYPKFEFYYNDHLYMMSYSAKWEDSEDLPELEEQMCYNESYSYNKKRNISISKWEYKSLWIFNWFEITYEEGNVCATEYLLEERYIQHFLENAIIKYNEENVDLAKLIEGKEAIVGNTKYPWNDDNSYISYVLDKKHMEMFISTTEDGLLVIQVGLSDESPKFIAYR